MHTHVPLLYDHRLQLVMYQTIPIHWCTSRQCPCRFDCSPIGCCIWNDIYCSFWCDYCRRKTMSIANNAYEWILYAIENLWLSDRECTNLNVCLAQESRLEWHGCVAWNASTRIPSQTLNGLSSALFVHRTNRQWNQTSARYFMHAKSLLWKNSKFDDAIEIARKNRSIAIFFGCLIGCWMQQKKCRLCQTKHIFCVHHTLFKTNCYKFGQRLQLSWWKSHRFINESNNVLATAKTKGFIVFALLTDAMTLTKKTNEIVYIVWHCKTHWIPIDSNLLSKIMTFPTIDP